MHRQLHNFLWATALVCLGLTGTVAFAQYVNTENLDRYEVQPGDILQISVWKEPDLQQEVLIRPDGKFSFPLVGEVLARGQSVNEIQEDLRESLVRFIPDLVVTVTVTQILGNKIYVIGQVRNASAFVVNPRVDVMQALSMAGGTTPFASLNDIKILRREKNQLRAISFRYDEVAKGKNLEQNIVLHSGDIVVVP